MPEVKIRLRHPGGVTTLDVDPETTTIGELKMMIFSTAEIEPGEQEVKYGYPPKSLPNEDDRSLASIPITKGEQIVVARLAAGAKTSQAPSAPPTASAPAPKAPKASSSSDPAASVEIPLSGGQILQHVVVPDDNSCLFNSLGVVFKENASDLRRVVASKLEQNPTDYPDVVLGFCNPTRGEERSVSLIADIFIFESSPAAAELAVFADHFKTEIASFDVQSGRVDRFGEGKYDSRCILVYSGIHYDAIVSAPMADAPVDFCTSVFPATDDLILSSASQLVAQLKARHYYTDTQNFDLRCQVCKVGLKGEKGAREHAMQTGHVDFGEY